MAASGLKESVTAPAPGRWLDAASSRIDRFPRLGDGMADVARALTESLDPLLPSPVEVLFNGFETGRIDRVLNRRGGKPVFAIAQASGWNTPVALQFDQIFVAVVVHALFGGAEEEFEFPERNLLTPLETRIAALMTEQIAESMTKGFDPIMPSSFVLEPIRPKPDPTLLGKPAVPVLIATFVLQTVGQAAEFDIVIPYPALELFAERLTAAPSPQANVDPRWSEKLESEVSRARISLDARLELPGMTLGEIASMRPGQVLRFALGASESVRLSCSGTDLFRCDLGQSDGFYSLKIAEDFAVSDPSPHKAQ